MLCARSPASAACQYTRVTCLPACPLPPTHHVTRLFSAQTTRSLSGMLHDHSLLGVMYCIINLHASVRMSAPALQIATVVNEHDAKATGMDEVLNGGSTSIGAQLRALGQQHETTVRLASGTMPRQVSYHAVCYAADFPAAAAGLASKGSTSAHRYDRKSTIDQRSPSYNTTEPVSLLHPREGGFKRVTYKMFHRYVRNAASLSTAAEREAYLTDVGLNAASFSFDGQGGYQLKFALSRVPGLDWLEGNSHDWMHTSLLGPVNLEIGNMQYVFIRIRGYYARLEINDFSKHEYEWPAGCSVPEFGHYVEVGIKGNLPDPTGSARFSAAQARHWLEHGTQVMEGCFARKVCPASSYSHGRTRLHAVLRA